MSPQTAATQETRASARRRAELLAERIEEGAAGLAAFAEGLSEAEWQTAVSGTDTRPVGVIVHHVASMYPIEIDVARAVSDGKAITDVTWEVVAEINSKHAQEHAGVSKAATLELLRRNSREAAAAVRALTDDQLDQAAPFSLSFGAPVTAQFVIEDHALRHSWHHLARIRRTLAGKGASVNPNKALWEKGDFTEIAAFMRESGEAVVKSLGIATPLRVLDLGCGDGTTAVPLARAGAEVVGIDIARNLVDAGNKRAAELGLTRLKFQEGDACNLQGVGDHSFDLTISIFGAMFAPKPFDVAKELVRVTKPGGRIVMGNWIPNDPTSFVSQLLKISASFMPPPPEGFISPMTWGVDTHIIERFGQAGVPKEKISMVKDTYYFTSSEKSTAQFIDLFERFYGPTMNAVDAAQKSGKVEELHNQLLELAKAQNKSTDGSTSIPATFLRVTVSL